MEYKILGSGDKAELEKQVVEEIERGWTPLGGVSVCTYKTPDDTYPSVIETNAFYFCQAMFKDDYSRFGWSGMDAQAIRLDENTAPRQASMVAAEGVLT